MKKFLKKIKNKYFICKQRIKDKIKYKFVHSRFATLKRLSKLNKRSLWKLYLEKNYSQYSYKVNVNKWLPDYLINHAKYVYAKDSKVPVELRDKTFELAIKVIYNCIILEYAPVHLIKSSVLSAVLYYMDWGSENTIKLFNESVNSIGLKIFSKLVDINKYEVSAVLTSSQIEKTKEYGIDIKTNIIDATVEEIVDYINKKYVDLAFKLGATNAKNNFNAQQIDLNLWIGKEEKSLKEFASKPMIDINNEDIAENWGNVKPIKDNNEDLNIVYIQRKLTSRILAAANLVSITGRMHRPNILITNALICSSLAESPGFIVCNIPEEIYENIYGTSHAQLYKAGELSGITVLCDPNMAFNDTRICLGYTGDTSTPGIHIVLGRILANPKIIVQDNDDEKIENYANISITTLGNCPEAIWYTFAVDTEYDLI